MAELYPPHEILLIEDSPDDAATLKKALTRAGLVNPIRHLADGAVALAYLADVEQLAAAGAGHVPAIFLIDIKLPNKSGFEILEWLGQHRAFDKSLKIVVSAMEDVKDVNKAYRLGAHSFLLKPAYDSDVQGVVNAFRGYWLYAQQVSEGKQDK